MESLRRYIALAAKWWWLIILLMLIASASSYFVSRRLTPVYQSSTTVLVGRSIQATDLDTRDILTSERLALTYANVARRRSVLQAVVGALGLNVSWEDLQKRVRVELVRDTQLLEIIAEGYSPEEARAIADEVARQLILLSPTHLQDEEEDEKQLQLSQRLETLQVRIDAASEKLAALEAELAEVKSPERLQELQGQISILQRLITDWELNHTQLLSLTEGKESPNYLVIVDPAQANLYPVRPRILLNTVLAGVAGLAIAIGVISVLEYLDDTLKSLDDLRQSLSLTPLGAIIHFSVDGSEDRLIALHDSFSASSEGYRMVRSNIQFAAVDGSVRTILVTSPGPGEGKSTTAANLSVVMAQAGLKTIVIDGDLRRPMQHQIFGLVNLGGLTDLLTSPKLDVKGYLRRTDVDNLHVITSGLLPPNPSELLGSERMKQLLADLSELADVVILDSPPATVFADAVVLSNRVDGVVLVTAAGQTRRDSAQQAILNLQQAGASLLGAVVNQVPPRGEGHAYQRYYAAYRQDDPSRSRTDPKVGHWWQSLPFMRPSK